MMIPTISTSSTVRYIRQSIAFFATVCTVLPVSTHGWSRADNKIFDHINDCTFNITSHPSNLWLLSWQYHQVGTIGQKGTIRYCYSSTNRTMLRTVLFSFAIIWSVQ